MTILYTINYVSSDVKKEIDQYIVIRNTTVDTAMNTNIKSLFLAIQKDNFDQFMLCFKECEKYFDTQITQTNITNYLRSNNSEDFAVHIAARHGRLSILKYLIEKGACVDLLNHNRKTPLHDAAQFSQYETVVYLLSKGANVNAVKNADWTPLMLACTKLQVDVISILLSHGADPLFKNKDGWNSFHIASREGSVEILQLLVLKLADPTVERLNQLVNSKSKNGRKPLHTAALHGRIDVVDYILRSNFTAVNDIDNCGETALMDAIRSGSIETFELLVQYGAEVRQCNKIGYNCLHIAAESGVSNVICHLVQKYNFDINALTERGSMTSIQIAKKEKQLSAVNALELVAAKNVAS